MVRVARGCSWLAVFTVICAECGGDPPPSMPGTGRAPGGGGAVGTGGTSGVDPLVGSWQATLNTSCLAGATFGADTTYVLNVVCVLADLTLAIQSEQGTYTTVGDHLNFLAMNATCSDTMKSAYLIYSVTASALTLSDNVTVIAYVKAPTPTAVAMA
jgi:hypothetical protein